MPAAAVRSDEEEQVEVRTGAVAVVAVDGKFCVVEIPLQRCTFVAVQLYPFVSVWLCRFAVVRSTAPLSGLSPG